MVSKPTCSSSNNSHQWTISTCSLAWINSSSSNNCQATTSTNTNSSKTTTITLTWWISTKWINKDKAIKLLNRTTGLAISLSKSQQMFGLRAAVSLTCLIWNPVTNLVSSSTPWTLNSKLATTTATCSQQVMTWTNSGLRLTLTPGSSVTILEGPASNRTKEVLSLWLTLTSNKLSLTINLEWTHCNNKYIPIRW